MVKTIKLNTWLNNHPIVVEITGIMVTGCSGDENDNAIVNGVIVTESFYDVVTYLSEFD